MDEKEIKVTGTRVFDSGAHRDPNETKGRYDLLSPLFLRRLAIHTQKGGVARGDRNWEAGMPMDAVLDSAIRHLYAFLEGDRSEDHLAAAAWNVMNLIHTEEQIDRGNFPKSLAEGLPDYTEKEKPLLTEEIVDDLFASGTAFFRSTEKCLEFIPHNDLYPNAIITYPGNNLDPYYNPEGLGNPDLPDDPGHLSLYGDFPYDDQSGPHENWQEAGSKDLDGNFHVPAMQSVSQFMEPEEEEPSCANCIDADPDGSPVPFSDKCGTCTRLGSWEGV